MVGIDGRDNPKIMDRLLILLKNGADLVIASRFHPKGKRIRSDFLSYRGLGNRFFSFLLSIIFNRNDVTDCNNSYRAFKKSVYNKMSLDHAGNDVMFLMTVKAMENKFNFQETPTVENRELIRTKKGSPLINAVHFILILIVYLIMPKKSEKY